MPFKTDLSATGVVKRMLLHYIYTPILLTLVLYSTYPFYLKVTLRELLARH